MSLVIVADEVRLTRSTRTVVVTCPFCATKRGRPVQHRHGWPYTSPSEHPGGRASHCVTGPGGDYFILRPDAEVIP
jgi:hypothetical protein